MSKEELLQKTFDSSCDAMTALAQFLDDVDKSCKDETRGSYQHLKVIGNRIFE